MGEIFHWRDETTWPDDWPGCDIDPNGRKAGQLARRLQRHYTSFVAYHGCRPMDVSSYYTRGVQIGRSSDLLMMAIEVFARGDFPEIRECDVVAACEAISYPYSGGVYVTWDDRMFTGSCGHYVRSGSEYVLCIAAELSRELGGDYKEHLRAIGTPTIFELELPFEWLSEEQVRLLATRMSRAVLYDGVACVNRDAVNLCRAVPPELVRGHKHPPDVDAPAPASVQHLQQQASEEQGTSSGPNGELEIVWKLPNNTA